MTDLHKYEEWLDELDTQLRVDGANIACTLGCGLIVPIKEVSSATDIVFWANSLQECLSKHESYVPIPYLMKRFVTLIKKETGLPVNVNEIVWEVTVGYRRG